MTTAHIDEDAVLHTFAAAGPIHVDAQLRSSSLKVTAGEVDEISVQVSMARGVHVNPEPEAVVVELSADTLRIEVPSGGGGLGIGPLQIGGFLSPAYSIEVSLPQGSSLQTRAGSGSVTTAGPLTRIRTASGSGRTTVEQAREIASKAGSGSIIVDAAERLEATAGSGGISVTEVQDCQLTVGSGNLRIGTCSGRAALKAGSGGITLSSAAAEVSAVAGSGDIEITELTGRLASKSGSGGLTVHRAREGTIAATAATGDIVIGIPEGTAVFQDCSTVSGSLRSELDGVDAPEESDHCLELQARTVSGSITVRRG